VLTNHTATNGTFYASVVASIPEATNTLLVACLRPAEAHCIL
jgi:hypothetical protein